MGGLVIDIQRWEVLRTLFIYSPKNDQRIYLGKTKKYQFEFKGGLKGGPYDPGLKDTPILLMG